jgi:hypothetical protein
MMIPSRLALQQRLNGPGTRKATHSQQPGGPFCVMLAGMAEAKLSTAARHFAPFMPS